MKKIGNMILGLVLIIIGLIIGMNSLGITNINIFFKGWWTLFIIIPCFIGLLKDKDKIINLIGLIIAVLLLLGCQDIIDFKLILKLIFPLILVVIGLSIIFKDIFNKKINKKIKELNKKENKESLCNAFFSEQNIKFDNELFKGSNLKGIFGTIKYDLRNAIIDEDVVINVNVIFGEIDIFIPSNVKVITNITSVFCDVEDNTNVNDKKNVKTIYINGISVFGGIKIKR